MIAELLERGGQVVIRVECPVCAPGEPTLTRDCGNCDASGAVDEAVPVMEFVRFVLEHVPERVNVGDVFAADGQINELRKTLTTAIDRANRRNVTEESRQAALQTATEAAQAITTLRAATAAAA